MISVTSLISKRGSHKKAKEEVKHVVTTEDPFGPDLVIQIVLK